MPLALRGAAGGDPVAGAAQVADHRRARPSHRGVYGDPDRLVDDHDLVVVVDDPDALDHLGHHRQRVVLAREDDLEQGAGDQPVGLRGRLAVDVHQLARRAARPPCCARCRTSGPARRRPAPRRGPPGPAGCAPRRRSRSFLVRARVVGVPGPVQADHRGPAALRTMTAATSMQMSATLNTGQCGSAKKSTTWPRNGPGSRNRRSIRLPADPGEQQAEGDRPAAVSHPEGEVDDDHRRDDRDHAR